MEFMTVYQFNGELTAFQGKVLELKRELMAATITGQKELSTWKLDSFKIELKDLLHRVKLYGESVTRELKLTDLSDGLEVSTVPYDLIKEFIFLKPDYTSIWGFTSGLIQGTSPGGILVKPEDIGDFFVHTVESAFSLNVESTGELIEKCNFIRDSVEPMRSLDRKLFGSLSGYPDLFRVTDVGDIFTSVSRSLREVIDYLQARQGGTTKERLLDIAILNGYCEYLNFVVAVYCSRAFMVGYYLAPIYYRVRGNAGDNVKQLTEATEQLGETGNCQFEPLRELELGKVLEPKSTMIFLNVFAELVKMINRGMPKGIPSGGGGDYAWDSSAARAAFQRVITDSGLMDNVLVAKVILGSGYYDYGEARDEVPLNTTELYHNLKSSLANSKQGLQLKNSSKDDLIRVITAGDGVRSKADVRKLAVDSLILVGGLLTNLRHRMRLLEGTTDDLNVTGATVGNSKLISECHLMCLELYRDLASAGYEKAILLDKLHRHFSVKETDEVLRSTELNLDGLIGSSKLQSPDTMRVSEDMLPKYQRPVLEHLELQTEFMRSLPGFENDLYLSEAGDSGLINALVSMVEGLLASLASFFKNFKPAANWVRSREEYLRSLKFTDDDKLKGIHQYKVGQYENLIKGLKLNAIKSNLKKQGEEFTISLYPDKKTFDSFKADRKRAAAIYRNAYLFGKATPDEIATVTMSGNDLETALGEWIDDILGAEATMETLKKTNSEMREMVKYLRTEAVNASAGKVTTEAADANAPDLKTDTNAADAKRGQAGKTTGGQAGSAAGNDGKAEPQSKPNGSKPEGSKATEGESTTAQADDRLLRVQKAIINLWQPINDGLIKVLRDEYGYLKQAYSLGQARANSAEAKGEPQGNGASGGV